MVNPGAFRGLRDAFLVEQKPKYAAAILGNYTAECVADIQRRYFKRFPIELEHNKEPEPEFLAGVDDNDIDPEPIAPDEASMTLTEFQAATEEFANRRKLIEARKEVSCSRCHQRCLIVLSNTICSKSSVAWRICTGRTTNQPKGKNRTPTILWISSWQDSLALPW